MAIFPGPAPVPPMPEKTCVALIGLGTVGTGVARILLDHGDRTARHAGRTLWLNQVLVRDIHRRRDVDLPAGLITDDLNRLLADRDVRIVAHLMGGVEPARTIMQKLLESGKDVVTANKALLAEHGPELFGLARELGRTIAFEASVAGGVPIIANISQCLSANAITSLRGILNGTCNFILSAMDQQGAGYEKALAEAQQLGFAEADPTLDVDGSDAAQKLSILAHLAFGTAIHWSQIPRRGIDRLHAADFQFARQLGYRIKLIATAGLGEREVCLGVAPMLVRQGQPLAEVQRNFNAISVVGDAVGPVFFHGQGAGQMPTASAVVADLIDIATGRAAITFHNLKLWSGENPSLPVAEADGLPVRYYLRFSVPERTGVLAAIAAVLGDQAVSIASVYQHDVDRTGEGTIPLILLTHQTTPPQIHAAMEKIRQLPGGLQPMEQLKILD